MLRRYKRRSIVVMLYAMPELDADDMRVLAELDRFRAELRHHVAEPRRWLGQLRRSLVAGAIRGSNTIEGHTISVDDAEALVANETMPQHHDRSTEQAVLGYKDALTYVQEAAHFEVFSYNEMLLSALHFMMMRDELDISPGRYRKSGVWVTGGPGNPPVYTGPDPESVPELMHELSDWLDHGDLESPAFARASLAHLNLVSIHPWRDGNGRMSRCLHTLVLARDKVLAAEFSSIEEWLGASPYNTFSYYAALTEVQGGVYSPTRSAHSWIRFCLRAHHLQAQTVQRRTLDASRLWQELAALAAVRGMDPRVVSALFAAARGNLRRTTYQDDELLTRDQAIRDLRSLRDAGLIDEVGAGSRRRYLGSGPLLELTATLQAAWAASPLRDPYQS